MKKFCKSALYILYFCEVVFGIISLIFTPVVIDGEATIVCTYVTYISIVLWIVSGLLALFLALVENERIK